MTTPILKWSIPDTHPTGRAWTQEERERAACVADGCQAVGMTGIFNAAAADEYFTRALLLDLIAQWSYRSLTRAELRSFIGLRTGARKVARPMFLAYVSRALNWQTFTQLEDAGDTMTITQATATTLGRLDLWRTGSKTIGGRTPYPATLTTDRPDPR